MSYLLVGNGLNIANNNSFIDNNNVYERFMNNFKAKFILFKDSLYLNDIEFREIEELIDVYRNLGIEQVTGYIFEYLAKAIIEKNGELSWNACYRLIELLAALSLESLFIVDGNVMYPKVSYKYKEKLDSYDYILTLNYVEEWDTYNKCLYLHGNICKYFKSYQGQMIITSILKHTTEIKKYLNKDYIDIDIDDVIFVPSNKLVDKHAYVGEGLFCNKCGLNVYPADDLFPSDGKGDIYASLNSVEKIEIFGVSPFGEKSLIEKLTTIKEVIIYVYRDDEKEIKEWKKYIPNAIIKNSRDFLK